jgi:hypothetical protein
MPSRQTALYLLVEESSPGGDDITPGPGEERHSLFSRGRARVEPAVATGIPEQWSRVIDGAVQTISSAISSSPLGFELSEVELSFGVGSDGLLGLVVGLKAEGSVKIKFTPPRAK